MDKYIIINKENSTAKLVRSETKPKDNAGYYLVMQYEEVNKKDAEIILYNNIDKNNNFSFVAQFQEDLTTGDFEDTIETPAKIYMEV